MEFVYFTMGASGCVGLGCTLDGRIDFSALSLEFKLDPTSIQLNGSLFPKEGLKSELEWEQIKADFKAEGEPLGTKEDLVMITGEAAVLAVSTEGEPNSKKPKSSLAKCPSLDVEALVVEQSRYMQDLLKTPHELPIGVRDLREFLSGKLVPLLVTSARLLLNLRAPSLVRLGSPTQAELAALVESSCYAFLERLNSEVDSSHKLRILTGDFVVRLDELAPPGLKLLYLESTMYLAPNPSSASASSALVSSKRPNFALYLRNVHILRWENTIDSAHFSSALKENIMKLKIWSPLYYGELSFVIGGCCGGREFQWLKLSPDGDKICADPISEKFDLWTPSSGVELLHSVVQMHRLLQKLQGRLTTDVPVSVYKEIKCVNGGTVLLGPEHVLKTLVPKLTNEKVNFLQSLYKSITGSKYLVQLKGEITSTRASTMLYLYLYLVGIPNGKPACLKDLGNAMHDMLHGLVVLHEAGYTHRDLQWEKYIREIVRGEMKWIIIDLESARSHGDLWKSDNGLVNWDARTLEDDESYTKGSDMYELGKLVVNWVDESGEDFG